MLSSLNILLPISLMMFMKVDKYLSSKGTRRSVVFGPDFHPFLYTHRHISSFYWNSLQRAAKRHFKILFMDVIWIQNCCSEYCVVVVYMLTQKNVKKQILSMTIWLFLVYFRIFQPFQPQQVRVSSSSFIYVNYFDTFSCYFLLYFVRKGMLLSFEDLCHKRLPF